MSSPFTVSGSRPIFHISTSPQFSSHLADAAVKVQDEEEEDDQEGNPVLDDGLRSIRHRYALPATHVQGKR